MTENLLTQSVIKLFGRLLQDMQFVYDPTNCCAGLRQLFAETACRRLWVGQTDNNNRNNYDFGSL